MCVRHYLGRKVLDRCRNAKDCNLMENRKSSKLALGLISRLIDRENPGHAVSTECYDTRFFREFSFPPATIPILSLVIQA